MRSIYLAAGATLILGLFGACGGDDKPGALPDTPGSSAGKAGNNSSNNSSGGEGGEGNTGFTHGGKGGTSAMQVNGGEGGEGEVTPNDPLAPTIIITSPQETDDPNGKDVLSGNSVSVTCVVTESTKRGASAVNESSVKIAVLGEDGKVIEESAGVPTTNAHEFATTLSLTEVPAGAVTFVCRASDIAQHAGSAQLGSLLDKGPAITISKPVPMSAHALGSIDIDFGVAESPIAPGDKNAGVSDVSLNVAGVDIDLADASDMPGHYRLQVNLRDPRFNPTPNGTIPITVKASNERTPSPVEASLTRSTDIDGAGPIINIATPIDKDVVGGTVRLTFSVNDAISGVDPGSVMVSLNKEDHPYDANSDRWTRAGNNFTFDFDSRQVKDAKVQITVNIGASDMVGNISPVVSELLYLDNFPPVLDLDPLNVRTRTRSVPVTCSVSFDPVGDKAKDDLDSAAVAGIFRAVVWDTTNTDSEIPISHFSNTNPSSVRLYLEGDNAKPLLIDKNSDGLCDEVAKVDSTDSIVLNPIPVSGSSRYSTQNGNAAPSAAALQCGLRDADPPPAQLCDGQKSDMWQVIQDDFNQTPVIYAVSVSGAECTGVSWEFTGKLTKDGWVCFAARGVDNAGNVGISRPLRLCVDDPDVPGTPACASGELPPTCTDGCTPPARWGNVAIEIP